MLLLGGIVLLTTGCMPQAVTEFVQPKKNETKIEQAVVKQKEKIVPEVKVIGEHGAGAGIIVKQDKDTLYILTNGALVATNTVAFVKLNQQQLVVADIHYMSTAHNIALLKVNYPATVSLPVMYTGHLDKLAVYTDGFPYTIEKYNDRVAAYYIDAQQPIPLGSAVLEEKTGALVGIYFTRQEKSETQPYILAIQQIVPLLEEWINEGMEPKVRLVQSQRLLPYLEEGDQAIVQQAVEQYGTNIFAYQRDEIQVFLDAFHKQLKIAVDRQDTSTMTVMIGTEVLQQKVDDMVKYYASKKAKIRFSQTTIQQIEVVGQTIKARVKTAYMLTNAAGQEATASATTLYEMQKNSQGDYQMTNLTIKE
ncbi:hypothetical protein LYSBPC_22390 [Lysinibacillus piscis]|uniref:TcaA protein NTF2-like domain-containing protein n=2 Tax=Lysinibacillus piscis TaxID=2518931 RepID=A0ABQ5NL74_9BACI|nr:hypothetical protein LYSBPC_22390 [Lysinibacillus sp. KH24]